MGPFVLEMRMKFVLPVFASLLLGACVGSTTRPPSPTPTPAPKAAPASSPAGTPANDLLVATAWTHSAVEHDLIYREIYRNAQEKLLKALHDPHWDALPHNERDNAYTQLKPAVILDVDETVLDNSPYEVGLIRKHQDYNEATWATWVKQARARALPGALAFTRFAASHGIRVFYVSNRDQSLNQATLENLRKVGFPVQGNAFLGLGTMVKGCHQVGKRKTCRRRLVGQNYRVLMQFGDQVGDFVAVPDNTPQARRAVATQYRSWFGERWFVLPNPMYGDWLPALFGNDWKQPAAERREAILKAMESR
jgi:acid phosphatase